MVTEFISQGMPQSPLVMLNNAFQRDKGICIAQEWQLAIILWVIKVCWYHRPKEVEVMIHTILLSMTQEILPSLFCFMIINIIQNT